MKKVKNLPFVQIDEPTDTVKWGKSDILVSTHVIAHPLQVSLPLHSPIINSEYGHRIDPLTGKTAFHQGIDFKAKDGSVLSIMPGKVKKVGYSKGLGSYIEIEHGAYRSVYGHLSAILVRESMTVPAGAVIAITGSTGRSTGEHLHFAIKHNGRIVNPTPYLDLIYRKVENSSRATEPLSSVKYFR
ncbi:M23 family metallopeptidase [Pontibacter ummariensis]|uniref:M23 family metallopeptidase n=1 Tax=Pontibacter ummariensis TaxID=1610492 RepID=UPI0015C63BBA|nr:M23 family metallopeptidase [Pontibacter ummariensis]